MGLSIIHHLQRMIVSALILHEKKIATSEYAVANNEIKMLRRMRAVTIFQK
jgi:hypothetical protein